ncbi:AAA-like domain-containing protein [Pseudomonas quasicaspiana]|uniref:AAA-like domain-containing protein n=1 Tax=Pseudomonas quasicaspiana TaxID=2829821 RepID=UPI001E3AC442|nr:AAA-like domain-containing protein [Pseudomonas quasicaspiana]MCD5980663.1 AAA-like domain-containing protein [Pseudomonas quasicaspiana]
MSSKILRRSTIIPIELYVERAADRQLKSIVEDMGRPGYVLVARQMGKTNLLIHMKRTRVNDLVLYKDLSTQFDSPRSFFRDIIDSLIESFSEFQGISSGLVAARSNEVEPNIEYDRHLRLLLKSTDRKVIIVLDEIDSLVGSSFSDVVFAQIRSMYFSRINFPEYERLTYVLSGVAEPTDLIKNKNISPFNIGEKIYLEDFARAEFDGFAVKSNLALSEECLDRVYYWTKGNPRTTWDLCSELEDLILQGDVVDELVIDEAVNKLYLRDFDRAPIDHIRTLVESDKVVRDAIASIRWGQAEFVDDKTKSRLYLAGITGTAGGVPVIKNKIIDESLSDSWIKSITPQQMSPLRLAAAHYEFGNHSAVVGLYEQIKLDSTLIGKVTLNQRLQIATSYLWMGQPEVSISEFEACLRLTNGAANRQEAELRIGGTLAYFGEYPKSIEFFKAAGEGPSPILKYNAQLSLADVYSATGLGSDDETLTIIDDLIVKLDAPEVLGGETGRSLYVHALACKARVLIKIGSFADADMAAQKAFPMATYSQQPKLLLMRYDAISDRVEQADLLYQICSIIISNQVSSLNFDGSNIAFDNRQLAVLLGCLIDHGLNDLIEEFIDYVTLVMFDGKSSRVGVALLVFNSIPSKDERASNVGSLRYTADNWIVESTTVSEKLKLYRELATHVLMPETMLWRIKYLDEIERHSDIEHLCLEDINELSTTAWAFRRSKDFVSLERLFDFWDRIQARALELSVSRSLFVFAHGMLYSRVAGDVARSKGYAEVILDLMNANHQELMASSMSEDFITIKERALELLRVRIDHDPYRHIGRNQKVKVKYMEGQVVHAKFKQVKEDVESGVCVLLEE